MIPSVVFVLDSHFALVSCQLCEISEIGLDVIVITCHSDKYFDTLIEILSLFGRKSYLSF
jgi:hypothetical protein